VAGQISLPIAASGYFSPSHVMSDDNPNPRDASNRSSSEERESSGVTGAASTSDAALMSRVLANDQNAMAAIFDRYGSLVYSVALRILKDPGNAEDVLQEIFVQVWKNPAKFAEGRGSLPAWLAVVARNRAIDALRQRKPSEPFGDVVVASPGNVASEVERNRMIEKVRHVMKGLPDGQQRLVELAFFEGLTHSEIAARTGEPLGTVKTRIRTALASLRKEMEA
jgi:RNA polymerase sigma-70 factor, ECF subfamily